MIAQALTRTRSARPGADDTLRAEAVRVHFEGVKAVDGVDLELCQGELLGLIGPNGAGKTTLVNALTGFQRPTSGRVLLGGRDITGWSPNRLGPLGIARTFQAVRLFGNLTALENLELGALGVGSSRHEARRTAWELLGRMGLAEKAHMQASALPYGDERRLGFLRALATGPAFLLLDEPAAGLNEAESDELMHTIAAIRDDYGCGVMVIEHDMRLIMRLSERIHVLDYGRTICEGRPGEVQRDPKVIEAYLGKRRDGAAQEGSDAGR